MSHTELSEEKIEELDEADEIDLDEVASCKLERAEDEESEARIQCEVLEEVWRSIAGEPVKNVNFKVTTTVEREDEQT